MRVLLDTHVLLWMAADDPRLPAHMREAIARGTVEPVVSAATVWEVAIKSALGKLAVPDDLFERAAADGFRPLAITWSHAEAAGRLPRHHADPFDRMLIAQARLEDLVLMSADPAFAAYDVALF